MPLVQQRSGDTPVHLDAATVAVQPRTRDELLFTPEPGATHVRRLPQTITETITTNVPSPTGNGTIASSSPSSTTIPVAAIAGGAVAGAALALLIAILWKVWSRAMDKDRDRQRYDRHFENGLEVQVDTRWDETSFSPLPMRSPMKASRRVQFHDIPPVMEDDLSFDDEEKGYSPFVERALVPSAPQPLRPVAGSPSKPTAYQRVRTASNSSVAFKTPPPRPGHPRARHAPPVHSSNPSVLAVPERVVTSPPVSPTRPVRRLTDGRFDELDAPVPRTLLPTDTASTIADTASFYSVQSGESRRPPVFGRNLLAAALGIKTNEQQRNSTVTKSSAGSLYSEPEQLSSWRYGPHIMGRSATKVSRLSSASSIGGYEPRLSAAGVPIGLATTGEEEEEEPTEY